VPIDLGSPLRPAGLPRLSSLNQRGWVVKPGDPKWMPLQAPESRSVVLADFVLDDAGALSGSMKKYHVGYSAVNERESLREDPSAAFLEKTLKERYPGATVDSVRIEKLEKIDEELIENVYCRIPDGVMATGDFMYLSAVFQPLLTENPFKLEKRLFPVDIPYPINDQYMMSLRLPEGYVVEELPESVNLVTPGNGARFRFMVQKKNERELQVVSQLKIEQLHYEPDEYTPLREIFARLIEKQEEQIVLRRRM
jgi:hypothetical protein